MIAFNQFARLEDVRVPYRRSQEIERRLHHVVEMIRSGPHTTHSLAQSLRTSEPTISRSIQALRERGFEIRSVKDGGGWRYELTGEPAAVFKG